MTPRSVALLLFIISASLALHACAAITGESTTTLTAGDDSAVLSPDFTTAVFSQEDRNSVHFYLTDIPDLATPESSGVGLTGNVLHVHMFLKPYAGRTPIAFTASNTTITHVVIADGAYAVYSGGGFLLPDSLTGGDSFSGRIRDATLRPIGATSGIADLLGWTTLSANINARRDDDRADQISAWLDAIRYSDRFVRAEEE